MRILRENTATRITVGPFYDVTDAVTPEIALTVTGCWLSFMVDDAGVPALVIDAAPTASGGSNDMVHVPSDIAGFYDLELTAAQTNYTGRAMLSIHDTDVHLPVFHEFQIVSGNVYDALYTDGDVLDVSVTQWLGTAAATPDTAGIPHVNTTHVADQSQTAEDLGNSVAAILLDTNELQTNQGDWATATGFATPTNITAGTITTATNVTNAVTVGNIQTNTITASSIANNAITSDKLATDAITSSELSVTAINEIQSGLATAAALTTVDNEIAVIDANIDTMVAGVIIGTAATGTLSTAGMTTSLTGYTADQLIGRLVTFYGGVCDGEQTEIEDFV